MNRRRLIRFLSAVLLAALSAFSCRRETAESQQAELQVALYIPDAVMTRADDPSVSPLEAEKNVTTLHVWAFLHDTGELVSYKLFNSDLDKSGLAHNIVTRFGLPLDDEMFVRLTTEPRPTVDVYAIANAASARNGELPDEDTSRAQLEALELNGIGGNSPLTMSVPTAGLPMSGMLKNASVTGGYPVLNITTLKLTRAVSKIRFVFCQQMNPAYGNTPAALVNDQCKIISIKFDGVENEKDCQIAETERLFTTQSFDIGGESARFSPLDASIEGDPLISNTQLAHSEDPEELYYRSPGHETESVEQYENRLATALRLNDPYGYPNSQVGPIYLRETNKHISGTITYRVDEGGPEKDKTVQFYMDAEAFPRNHSWIVYACFAQETMSLELRVVAMPWDYTMYPLDYTTSSVNVIRRFTVSETNPATFLKEETKDGFFDVTFWHTITIEEPDEEPVERPNTLHGDIIIATPVLGTLYVVPVAKTLHDTDTPVHDAIKVEPASATIYPNHQSLTEQGVIEDCLIPITISCYHPNDGNHSDEALEGNCIDLHFYVEIAGREIDLGSESIDYYRFILSKDWNVPKPTEGNNNGNGNGNNGGGNG